MTFLTLELRSGDPYPSLWERIGIQIPASNPIVSLGLPPLYPFTPITPVVPSKGPSILNKRNTCLFVVYPILVLAFIDSYSLRLPHIPVTYYTGRSLIPVL